MLRKLFLAVLVICLTSTVAVAQVRVITPGIWPQGYDNSSFGVFFYNGGNIYTLKGKQLFSGQPIADMKLNPSYTTLAALQRNKKGDARVAIYDINPQHTLQQTAQKIIKLKDANTTAIAYSANAKQLAIASSDKQITIYDPQTNKPVKAYASKLAPSKLAYSDNNYFLAAAEGKALEIWNLERGTVRKAMDMEADIKDCCFSNNSSNLNVLTADGKLKVYDTKTFDLLYTIEDLGQAIGCYPNEDGKYVAVITNPNLISIVNVLDPSERHMVPDKVGSINTVRLVRHHTQEKDYIIYNDGNSLIYREAEGLTPYYNKMMTTMLNERLNQWVKQMPGESMEAYQLRVNEASRLEQAKTIEREIATEMAAGVLELSDVNIGDYDTNSKSLALTFNSMPGTAYYLPVPINDLNDFTDTNKLEFHNAKYALNPDDKFELVYFEAYNPANGKTYVFDNLERRSMSFMQEDADFVPLEIVQKSNMEETALMGIKEDIFNEAKQENVISDKTHISVKTEAVNAVNADGQKIVNYNVGFTYEVEQEFSARDDFKPGHYHTEESAAAMLMLKIMTKAFEKDFAKYVVKGKRVKIMVKGTADASPINRTLAYDGKYGEYTEEPVYKDQELNNITLTKKGGIADNEQLAFARAIGVQNYIEKEISSFGDMERDYEYHIEVAKEEGSQFRRISVQYTFIDAF